ncbi:hypothetical protein [Microcoleus sp. N3A4]|uniref:hypothetical protein n=1 Tax=Microcoleus sp. N3A4 TaxID=3055379 RepID=UPI002FD7929C
MKTIVSVFIVRHASHAFRRPMVRQPGRIAPTVAFFELAGHKVDRTPERARWLWRTLPIL